MKKNFLGSVVALAVSLGILYGAVWIGSKAWQEGQKQKA
jgi:hypothetical protein